MSVGNPTRIQGLILGLGSAKQADISTPSATYNRWRKLDAEVPFLLGNTETDAAEIGKGTEFITGVFKTNKEPKPTTMRKYGSAEWLLWSWGYAMGDVALATGLYTIHAKDPGAIGGLENPYFSLVAQLAAGGGEAIDETHVGMQVARVTTQFKYGPGRQSITCDTDIVGSGISVLPSGVSVPAVLSEDYIHSSSAAITINGVDYVSSKMALEGEIMWENNPLLDLGYHPGSGNDSDGFAVRDRIFYGTRSCGFNFTAFLDNNSLEYAKLVAQTTGTATLTFTFDATHFITYSFPLVSFSLVERTTVEGLVCVKVTVAPHYDPTVVSSKPNGVLVVSGKCGISDIAQ